MRIAHIVPVYPPYGGGMGRVAYEMVEELCRMGHDAQAITPRYATRVKDGTDQSHVRFLRPLCTSGNAAFVPSLFFSLRGYDLVHLHYPFFGATFITLLFRLFHPHVPLVVSVHMDPALSGWRRYVHILARRIVLPLLLRVSDACIGSTFDYIASSEFHASFLAQKKLWHEIPFGVDTNHFSVASRRSDFYSRYGLDSQIPIILFVGGMDKPHAFKGVPVLLESLAILQKDGVVFQAVCVGKGPLREEYERYAKELGIAQHVHFFSDVTYEALPLFYQHAHVFVLPSVGKGESFGLVLLEAMACGTPVVATDIPGLRTVARVGGDAVPPKDRAALADALRIRLLKHLTVAEREALHHTIASRYSWESVATSLASLYASLVTKSKKEYTTRK